MSFFDILLEKRHYDTCPTPLWKLKIKDSEYQALKGLLAQECVKPTSRTPYMDLIRECALFYAEYWRREYKEGVQSREMLFNALEQKSLLSGYDWPVLFYEAACKGAKELKIEMYDGKKAMPFYSMLYQGGLPMNLVTQTDSNGTWDRFIRGLVFRNINFDELNLGLVATQSHSMRFYCSQLCDAIDSKQYMLMPFHCSNEYNPWFQFLLNKFSVIRCIHRQSHPFVLDWEFTVDKIAKNINIKYDLKGMQRLSPLFLEEQNLVGIPFFTVNVNQNDKTVNSFDYINGFCRYEVQSKHLYADGDVISVYLHVHEQPFISESLDLNTPHLLYRTDKGSYKLGNKIGKEKSLLLIPKSWQVNSYESLASEKFNWGDQVFYGILIPSEYYSDIIVSGPDGKMTFGSKSLLYWTELSRSTYNYPSVIETVYDADETSFVLCNDENENVIRKTGRPIEFRDKWCNDWKQSPSFGEILARTTEPDGNFVTPVRFINVGKTFGISVVTADSDTCQIQIHWQYGLVSTTAGRKLANGNWLISKDKCEKARKIPFEFTPTHNNRNTFVLNIKAPFKDFSIADEDGVPLENNRYIPFSDIDKFQYHIYGIVVRSFKFGDQERKINSVDNSLFVVGDNSRKDIPYDGALIRLFDSREQIRLMLDRTSKNMLEASVPIEFVLDNGTTFYFEIKESPYHVYQEGNSLTIRGKKWQKIDYKHSLKLLRLDNPEEEPITLHYDNDLGYKLPEEILVWGKTLVIGRSRGRICPMMVDLTQELSSEDREKSRDETIASILSDINGATLGSNVWKRILGWFIRAQKEDIPASSLLDLHCIALDPNSLLKFAFVLYLETRDDDKDNLLQKLIYFSNDLAFQWFWLLPSLVGVGSKVQDFIDDDLQTASLKNYYVQWALSQGEQTMCYLSALNDEDQYGKNCVEYILMPAIENFYSWAQKLCDLSMQESYATNTSEIEKSLITEIVYNFDKLDKITNESDEYVENNQESLGQDVVCFFSQYSESGQQLNDQWLCQRVNALASHMKGEMQIFSESNNIRRSLIFCYKSTRKLFLLLLNNKIAKR